MNECVNRLIAKPPKTSREAISLFDYFSSRLGEIGANSYAKLKNAKIVPVLSQKQSHDDTEDKKTAARTDTRLLTPPQCYLGQSVTYSEIFDFVDFGEQANSFLTKCGSKKEPTTAELAALACREPARLSGILVTQEKYINMLRTFADDLPNLKKDKDLFRQMKSAKWLMGSLDIPANKENRRSKGFGEDGNMSDDEMEDNSIKQWELVTASNVVVVSFMILPFPSPC